MTSGVDPTSESILLHPSLVATSVSPVTHGFVALMRSVPLLVCHFWMVSSYWTPGSAHCHAASETMRHRSRALWVSWTWPVVRNVVCHVPSSTTAFMNVSDTRTELFEFWPDTVP